MSDLQIALGTIGILVVGCVYAYNWWQERKLRQRLERAFDGSRDDVLLKSATDDSAQTDPRIEPRLANQAGAAAENVPEDDHPDSDDGVDPVIEFSAEINLPESVSDEALLELQSQIAIFGKPARIMIWDEDASAWSVFGSGSAGGNRLLAVLQLVDRAGPVHTPQLTGFCDAVQSWAERHDATVQIDEPGAALKSARDLDVLCGELDVAIGLNVVAPEGSAFPGEQVAAIADEAGFELGADGRFYWRTTDGRTLFTLENHDPEPFAADRLATLQTSGITLLLEVPHVVDGESALDEMARICNELAEALGGFVVDDNRVPLQAAGIDRIKAQLRSIREAMAAHEIPAGSPRAQRLFS